MKKKPLFAILPLLGLGLVVLGSCGPTGTSETTTSETTSETGTYVGDYKVTVRALGSTTIKVSNTLQLRSTVTGTTEKDVTWSSSDDSIASVDSSGLVTGLGEGSVTITASLNIEPACQDSIVVTVEGAVAPDTLKITGGDRKQQWLGEELQLGVDILPEEASSLVTWTSSNDQVATVSETGLVNFLAEGNVSITCVSNADENKADTVDFHVSYGTFYSNQGSPEWDVSHQADADPYVEVPLGKEPAYYSLYFNHVLSENYYVEVTFDITDIVSDWVWQGIGLGSGLSETDTRYFIFSPRVEGQGNDNNKCIVKDLPNESWPAITTRSQIWGENGLDSIDFLNDEITIGMLRRENIHYWTINGNVMWQDDSTKYEGIPTMPILVSVDIPCKVTDWKIETDVEKIDEILATPAYLKSFFATNGNTDYVDDTNFSFNNPNTSFKGQRVRNLGDKAKLVGDFTIEFDMADLMPNNSKSDIFRGAGIGLSRYDSPDSVETFLFGRSGVQGENESIVGRFATWNYVVPMEDPSSILSYQETSAAAIENPLDTVHIKISRTIVNNISNFAVEVDGKPLTYDVKSNSSLQMTSRYTGAYVIWVGAEYSSAAISNFEFTSSL